MKRAYTKPAMQAAEIQQSYLICTSDWDVMGQGQPNQPAGTPPRSFGFWDVTW